MTQRKLIPALVSLAVAATACNTALAQSSQATALEEIIVTAQKREESLQDAPLSVSAFSSEQLSNIGVFEAGDIARFTPNIHITKQSASQDNFGISFRGMSNGETAMFAEPTIGLYMDGVYIARTVGSAFDIVDLERIEVLRGPQGTLYGRNTIGGAINLITEKPQGELGFKQLLSGGARGYWRSQTTLDTDSWNNVSAKFSYLRSGRDGLAKNSYTGDDNLGANDTTAWRIALRWQPSDAFLVDYAYEDYERESNAGLSQLVHIYPNQGTYGGPIFTQAMEAASQDRVGSIPVGLTTEDDGSYAENDGHVLTMEWDLDTVVLKSITAYRDMETGTDDTDFGSFPSDGENVLQAFSPNIPVPEGQIVPLFGATRVSTQDQFTQEFQAIGDAFDDKLEYTLGLYWFEEEVEELNPQQITIPAVFLYRDLTTWGNFCGGNCVGKDTLLVPPPLHYGGDVESWAVYGQFNYSFTEKLSAILGMRYTQDDKEVWKIINGEETVASDDWSNFNPAITLDYQWSDELSTYLSFSTGYRSGGFNPRADGVDAFSTPYDEEEVESWELGWKSDWFDQRLRVNGAIFYYDYTDRQVNQFAASESGASSIIVNAGESEGTGFELEVSAIPLPGLLVNFNYGYLDFEFKSFVTAPQDPDTGLTITDHPDADEFGNVDISDDAKPSYTPEQTASLSVAYTFESFDWGTLTMGMDATYVDEIYHHAILNKWNSRDEQTRLNARITLDDIEVLGGRLKVSGWGRNITNEEHREFGIDFGQLGFAINSYQQLASWGIDLTYEYGR